MKHYFFRDKYHEDNFLNGKTYHATGYVKKLYCELGKSNPSGKDLSVFFLDPFNAEFIEAWRSLNEVELFEVDEWEYKQLVKRYNFLEQLNKNQTT